MSFLSISVGPDYLFNDGDYGTFNSGNSPLQNYRIYDNEYIDDNGLPIPGYINLRSTLQLENTPLIVLSDNPSTETNSNGIVLDKSFRYLHRATINGTSGYYSPSAIDGLPIPIPNPIRILSNSDSESVFDKLNDYFIYVNEFVGIEDKIIKDLLSTDITILPGANLTNIIADLVADAVATDDTGIFQLELDNITPYYIKKLETTGMVSVTLKAKPGNIRPTILRYQP
jgi:hypothetical protein